MIVTVYSSLLFFVNYLNALYNEYNVYALLFLGLTISSVLHHSSYKNETIETIETIAIIDKIFLYSVILYGGYLLLNKIIDYKTELASITPEKIGLLITIFSTFLGTIFLFCSEKK